MAIVTQAGVAKAPIAIVAVLLIIFVAIEPTTRLLIHPRGEAAASQARLKECLAGVESDDTACSGTASVPGGDPLPTPATTLASPADAVSPAAELASPVPEPTPDAPVEPQPASNLSDVVNDTQEPLPEAPTPTSSTSTPVAANDPAMAIREEASPFERRQGADVGGRDSDDDTGGSHGATGADRWVGVECPIDNVRETKFYKHGCGNLADKVAVTCNVSALIDDLPPTNESLTCSQWNRVTFRTPRTAATAAAAVARAQRRMAQRHRCTAADLQRNMSSASGAPVKLVATGEGAAKRYRLRVDGCDLDDDLLDDPDALLGVLRALSADGRRPIVLAGDSVVRHVFQRLVMALRGPQRVGEPPAGYVVGAGLEGWFDLVYVLRQHDDEIAIVHDHPVHFPHEGARRTVVPVQWNGGQAVCWDRASGNRTAAAVPARPASFHPAGDSPLASGGDGNRTGGLMHWSSNGPVCARPVAVGPVWCDPDDPDNPCLLRVMLTFMTHEWFTYEHDYTRYRAATYRRCPPTSNSSCKEDEPGTRARVDCTPAPNMVGRATPPPLYRRKKNKPGKPVPFPNDVHSDPLELTFDDVPALHLVGYFYWAVSAGYVPSIEQGRAMLNSTFGRAYSLRQRLWLGHTCPEAKQGGEANNTASSAPRPPVPRYNLLWLTTPTPRTFRGIGHTYWKDNGKTDVIQARNALVRQSLAQVFDPARGLAELGGEGPLAAAVEQFYLKSGNFTPPPRSWARVFDYAAMADSIYDVHELLGIDEVHWTCLQRPDAFKSPKDFAIVADHSGCRGDVNTAALQYLFTMAFSMAVDNVDET